MLRRWFRLTGRAATLTFSLLSAGLVLTIIAYPDQAFQASLRGLRLWWDQVFPALLPVLVITELLAGFGMLHALGLLLAPLFRLFRLPGVSGWALAAGLVGGYPLGADAAVKLRRAGLLRREDGERLLAISHLANPMLVIGVVGAGFLHSPEAGLILAALHYAAAFAAALLDRLYRKLRGRPAPQAGRGESPSRPAEPSSTAPYPGETTPVQGSLLTRLTRVMDQANREDGRTFGKLLGDSVSNAIQTLMMVGGLMMIFSVAVRLVELHAGRFLQGLLPHLLPAVLEPHLGANAVADALSGSGAVSALQAAAIGAVLGWSGFSLHVQVMALTRGTDLRYGPFLRFRLLHGAAAFLLTLPLWSPLTRLFRGTEAVFSPDGGWARLPAELPGGFRLRDAAALWGGTLSLLGLVLAAMLLVALLIRLLDRSKRA